MLRNVDVRLAEAIIWEKIHHPQQNVTSSPHERQLESKLKGGGDSKASFLEISQEMYDDYVENLFMLLSGSVGSLSSLVSKYQSQVSENISRIKEKNPGMNIEKFVDTLLKAGRVLADKAGCELDPSYDHLSISYINKSVALYAAKKNTMFINKKLVNKNKMELFYIITHEFGHHLYQKLVEGMKNIGSIFKEKTDNGYDFIASIHEGFAVLFTEYLLGYLSKAGISDQVVEDLKEMHHFSLYLFSLRAYASSMVGSGKWSYSQYAREMQKLGMDEERIQVEYMNLIPNLGYKESYILAFETLKHYFNDEGKIDRKRLKKAISRGFTNLQDLVAYMNEKEEENRGDDEEDDGENNEENNDEDAEERESHRYYESNSTSRDKKENRDGKERKSGNNYQSQNGHYRGKEQGKENKKEAKGKQNNRESGNSKETKAA